MVKVVKNNGKREEFNENKIFNAIRGSFEDTNVSFDDDLLDDIVDDVKDIVEELELKEISTTDIFNIVSVSLSKIDVEVSKRYNDYKNFKDMLRNDVKEESFNVEKLIAKKLINGDNYDLLKQYIHEQYRRNFVLNHNHLDQEITELLGGTSVYWESENSNKKPKLVTTQRDYLAGIVSTDFSKRNLVPEDIIKAHEKGILHFHDLDYFAQNALHNCDLINLEDMLQNGTVISGKMIEKPKSFSTACTITTQIISQVASSQYGGCTITLSHLAPFIDISRKKIRKKVEKEIYEDFKDFIKDDMISSEQLLERIETVTEKRLLEEVKAGVQCIQYQVITLQTTNGQAPFLSVMMYLNEAKNEVEKKDLALLIEETLKQRILGVKNEQGVYITVEFPKLLYVLQEDNINEGDKYWYLTKLAAECTSKRFVPDYISEKIMLRDKIDANGNGQCYSCMGCRSFLSPYVDSNYNPKYYGRFNAGVVTINLPDIALSSNGDIDEFWDIFEERLELCHKALRTRINRLSGTPSDVAPILWQYGALGRLKPGEKIDKLLFEGSPERGYYTTISLGYGGLYECVKFMTGKSHTDRGESYELAMEIMKRMNKKCDEWKLKENIGYSIYGTPMESTTYKFAKCLRKRFGIIEGITDRNYITNSYHVPVFEKINPFEKLKLEGEFQPLSPGGCISYIEASDLSKNLSVLLEVIKFMYDNIMYAEINIKSDYCKECGFTGEMKLTDDMEWYCPNCGNNDKDKLFVTRRTCGYIGSNFWSYGRTQEIKERYVHLDDHDMNEE